MSDTIVVDETTGEVVRPATTGDALPIVLLKMDDERVVAWTADALDERTRAVEMFDAMIAAGKREIERRLLDRGARAIPHPEFEVALEEQFSAYAFNLEALRSAAALLPEDEAAKIIKHVREQVAVIPAHDEPGSTISILALAKKYPGSRAGDLLAAGATRASTGLRLVFKRRAPQKKALR